MRAILRIRLLATAVAVVLALCAVAAAASEYYGVRPAGEVTATTLGALTFSGGGVTVRCNVTLRGSLDDGRLDAIVGTPIGAMTGASIAGCTSGAITAVLGLPWSIGYQGFTGTLPLVTGFRLSLDRVALLFNVLGFECLYSGTLGGLLGVTGSGPYSTGLLTIEAGRTLARVAGSELCPTSGTVTATFSLTPQQTVRARPIWIVSVGDSYISGEGGRWAGATITYSAGEYAAVDALGAGAYWDNSNLNGERTPFCHRSRAAEVHLGGPTFETLNLACSGSGVASRMEGSEWKPGLDFDNRNSALRGQALLLKELVTEWRRAIKLVVISIGGNDFSFGIVVRECLAAFNLSSYCSVQPGMRALFEGPNVAAVKPRIKQGILNVDRAMRDGGLAVTDYKLLVQNYMSPLPAENIRFRYPPSERTSKGGCGFQTIDASWANTVALGTINRTIAEAVAESGLTNVFRLDLSEAFTGRRLCETTVGLLEERGITTWTAPTAVDVTEWITQIRLNTLRGPYIRQEGFHPNYWGELALRACLRLAYNNGTVRGGSCAIAGTGRAANGEPRMRLD
jgi:hypothetical protein